MTEESSGHKPSQEQAPSTVNSPAVEAEVTAMANEDSGDHVFGYRIPDDKSYGGAGSAAAEARETAQKAFAEAGGQSGLAQCYSDVKKAIRRLRERWVK